MPYDPFSALSFITGPAILTNACAILQNGATTRYNLAVTQWREFRALIASGDDRLSLLYIDPERALSLAEQRIHLQLRALGLLSAGVALFAVTTVGGLLGAFLVQALSVPSGAVSLVMIVAGGAALAVMLAAVGALLREGACSRAMVRLHPLASKSPMQRTATPQAALGDEP
ncbi:DUF2721 domain-containing protein [Microvirga terrae]|uniref:DUF2721 domain-containing protein n=1 Tax=Microvirga terrae TaxID=2740529 RepID=A0ABY5RYX9_9HYPH|nr:DUF2721 domain-containing protein [Microvirga terrae]UVF21469.1 DUF2721 domain-containing protein [Microvirga terrae]